MRSSFDSIDDATGRRNETILESTGGVLTSCLMALKTNNDRRIDFVCVLASLVLNRLLLSAYRFLVLADVRLYGPTLLLQTLKVLHVFHTASGDLGVRQLTCLEKDVAGTITMSTPMVADCRMRNCCSRRRCIISRSVRCF